MNQQTLKAPESAFIQTRIHDFLHVWFYKIKSNQCKKDDIVLVVLTYVLSWRMKLEKLLCLKNRGSRVVENLWQSQTMKLLRALLHDTTESVDGSSTISNVLLRNGGGPTSCNPSIGCGVILEDEEDVAAAMPVISFSSSFTTTLSIFPEFPRKNNNGAISAEILDYFASSSHLGFENFEILVFEVGVKLRKFETLKYLAK